MEIRNDGSDFRDFSWPSDNEYEETSPTDTRDNLSVLTELKREVESALPWKQDRYSMLSLPKRSPHGGHTLPFHGFVKVHPELLQPGKEKLKMAIAVHERTHLHLGGNLRRQVFEGSEVDRFFHEVIVPAWVEEKVSLPRADRDFLIHKDWTGLYPGWSGIDIRLEDAVVALKKYFWLLERGIIRFDNDGKLGHQPDPEIFARAKRPEPPIVPLDVQLAENPEKFLLAMTTGYALGEDLHQRYRNQVAHSYKQELWGREEGLANFVSMEATGITRGELQQGYLQDEGKFWLTERLPQDWSGKVDDLLKASEDYPQFAEMGKNYK